MKIFSIVAVVVVLVAAVPKDGADAPLNELVAAPAAASLLAPPYETTNTNGFVTGT